MTLRELIGAIDARGLTVRSGVPSGAEQSAGREVAALEYDSRNVVPGAVFVGVGGEHVDGAAFAPQAVAKGAIAVVSERERPAEVSAPWVRVRDARLAMAVLASAFFQHPSRALLIVGITGTNGKTTTAYLVREVLQAAGLSCGLMGTVQYRVGPQAHEASRTTPEAVDLQRMLREMVDADCRACAMEVSSHALAQRRVDDTRFAAGVFTNLTRDHLDYHHDMDTYFAAKRRLFEMLPAGAPAVLNVDDPRAASLADRRQSVVTFAVDRDADVMPVLPPASLMGLTFDARTPAGTMHVHSRLAGRFNLYNLLAAAATGVGLGLPLSAVEAGLAAVTAVPGRFQIVSAPEDDVVVIVDYAHALKNLLEAVRPLARARMITVFGCGGDRDRTKRSLMGAVAARLSDLVVITSDNPRTEDPDAIIDEIERGIAPAAERARLASGAAADGRARTPTPWMRMTDRRAAITRAIADAGPGDVIVIAGKGHEKTQVIRDRELPFDDVVVGQDALRTRRKERV
ncbi:MAG: UDP-N-acetylmuramoyl-L-alanyl-D-glutamate--2,6-diaminopimelate ligase [Acidobacteria bacterium]|nr:UDP-N-acetylmuramoyl-L-alanyl-D-glutamate--2,6-diaminopimelate ligase [Acidobacteriota bacterium]